MKIPGFIRNDFRRKLVALLFAIIVYFCIWSQQRAERWINGVRVIASPVGQEYIMAPAPVFLIDIRVSGPSDRIDMVKPSAFFGEVKIGPRERVGDDDYEVTLTPRDFHGPSDFKVVKVGQVPSKAVMKVRMQRRITKELPVDPRFTGKLSGDFRHGNPEVTPKKVTVTGAKSDVELLKEVRTEPIPLSPDIEESFFYSAKIVERPRVTVTPTTVEVKVPIERNTETVLKEIPVALLCDRNAEFEVSFVEADPRVSVTVRNETAAERVTPEKLSAFVDVTRLSSPGIHKVNVECHIREGKGTVSAIRPAEFSVKIVKAKHK